MCSKWVGTSVDIYELAQVLDGALDRGERRQPRILHVDDDPAMLDLVAFALEPIASVVSVGSVDEARGALLTQQFDLAVLDIALGPVSGLELLPELRNRNGRPIPVIIFSAHPPELAPNPRVRARLTKSRASLDELVAAIHDRLMLKSSESREEVA
jgi:CheY-like chemotaxis protein